MKNREVARDLQTLRDEFSRSLLSVDEVGSAFERLTYLLMGTSRDEDARLRGVVNDIELVRFTRLPKNQRAEISVILREAQRLFDGLT
jgi:hypothetical protein